MKTIETWIQLETEATKQEKNKNNIDVWLCTIIMDDFGKQYVEHSVFDTVTLCKQAIERKKELCQQAINCGAVNFTGFKL